MQFISGWKGRAKESSFWTADTINLVRISLWIHLCFAVPTAFLWIFVIVQGLRKFPHPVAPCAYSARHKLWAWPAAVGMLMTAVTGWIFYWAALVA